MEAFVRGVFAIAPGCRDLDMPLRATRVAAAELGDGSRETGAPGNVAGVAVRIRSR